LNFAIAGNVQNCSIRDIICSMDDSYLVSEKIHSWHTRGLKALQGKYSIGRSVIVSLEKHPRRLDSPIEVLPWQTFLKILWSGGFGV
jgi:hypothetical protein